MTRPQLLITAVAVALVGAVGLAPAALAASTPPNAFAVSPSRTTVPASFQPQVRTFTVWNGTSRPLHVHSAVLAFSQTDTGATVMKRLGPDSGARWLHIRPDHFTVPPQSRVQVRVRIQVPRSAKGSGQRYLAIRFYLPSVKSGATGATISPGVAGELVISVPGPIRKAAQTTLQAPSFSTGGPIPLHLTIANTGTVYSLRNGLSASAHGDIVSFGGMLVLAHATRTESATWSTPPVICLPCTINGPDGTEATVWIVPVWQLAGLLGLLAAIVTYLIWRRRRSSKASHRRRARSMHPASPESSGPVVLAAPLPLSPYQRPPWVLWHKRGGVPID